jgi:hypothetical protein
MYDMNCWHNVGFMGLCLSYSLTLTASQAFLTRYYSSLEQFIISVERIKQYMQIPPEPPAVIQENRPSPSWPSEGNIEIQNLMVMIIVRTFYFFLVIFFCFPSLSWNCYPHPRFGVTSFSGFNVRSLI